MKILLALPLLIPLAGCNTTKLGDLTPAQGAALACIAGSSAAALSSALKPNTAAAVTSTGQVLCTTATGVAAVVTK